MIDKWQALTTLTEAAAHYGLSHRTLGVLRALLSFLPARLIRPEPGAAIVFPSNRTLGTRLNGMPESTLRRHLAQLVQVGIVSRHDSANRKRFARGSGAGSRLAFGFDLSPLARHFAALQEHATEAAAQRAALAALRVDLAAKRQQLLDRDGPDALSDLSARVLRRKPDAAALTDALAQIEARLATEKTSAKDSQNERHIQIEFINNSDSEPRTETETQAQAIRPQQTEKQQEQAETSPDEPALDRVLQVCSEFKSYYPEPVRSWRDLLGIADRLTPMMGIEPPVFQEAMRIMGVQRAVTVVLCMLESLASIANPGGYLRRLSQRAKSGGFSTAPLLSAVQARG